MNHLGFVAAAYALGTLVPLAYGIAALTRARTAQRRLAAVEIRRA